MNINGSGSTKVGPDVSHLTNGEKHVVGRDGSVESQVATQNMNDSTSQDQRGSLSPANQGKTALDNGPKRNEKGGYAPARYEVDIVHSIEGKATKLVREDR